MFHSSARSVLFAASVAALSVSTITLAAQQPAPAPAASPVPAAPAAPAPLTADEAKPLLGDWSIGIQTEQGASTINLTLKADQGKAVGEIGSEAMGLTPVTDITKTGDTIVLRYSFDYQGNMVPTVVTLKPATADTLEVLFDFAGGAFTMPGTATRKKS